MHTDVHVCVCTHACMCVCMHTHFVGGGGGGGEKKSCIAANLQKTNIICRFVFCAHCRQTLRGPDSSSLTILQRICLPLKLLFRVHGAHMKINGAGCCLMVCRTSFCTCVLLLFFHSTLYWPWRRYLCRNYLHSGLNTHTVFTYIHTYIQNCLQQQMHSIHIQLQKVPLFVFSHPSTYLLWQHWISAVKGQLTCTHL